MTVRIYAQIDRFWQYTLQQTVRIYAKICGFCEIDRKNLRTGSSVVLVDISLYAESHLTVNSGMCYSYSAIINEREVMNYDDW